MPSPAHSARRASVRPARYRHRVLKPRSGVLRKVMFVVAPPAAGQSHTALGQARLAGGGELGGRGGGAAVGDGGGEPVAGRPGDAVDFDEREQAVGGIRDEALDDALLQRFRQVAEIEPIVLTEQGERGLDEFVGKRAAVGAMVSLKIDGEMVAEDGEVHPVDGDEQPVVEVS